jgi:hypothetical protein
MEDEDDETISINPWFYEDEETQDEQEAKQISPFTMAAIVITYLVLIKFLSIIKINSLSTIRQLVPLFYPF